MLTNEQIWEIARAQSAADVGCSAALFSGTESVVTDFHLGERARAYYKAPMSGNLISYGSNVVAAVIPEIRDIVAEYVQRYAFYYLFGTPNCLWLNERLMKRGHKLCYMSYYFLPDIQKLKRRDCPYAMRLLHPADFETLYTAQWSNALCAQRRALDVLAYGAFDGEKLIGLAGCSADCEKMWQIGVDVLPAYRGKGVASALTSNLAMEILLRDKTPFYCCAWSNIPSARNAVRSGFVPAWVEMSVKPSDEVDRANEV